MRKAVAAFFLFFELTFGLDVFGQKNVQLFFFEGLSLNPSVELSVKVVKGSVVNTIAADSTGEILVERNKIEISYNDQNGAVRLWCRNLSSGSDSIQIKSQSGKNKLSGGFPPGERLEVYILHEKSNTSALQEITIRVIMDEKRETEVATVHKEEKKTTNEIHPKQTRTIETQTHGVLYRVQILTSGKILSANDPLFKGESDVWRYEDRGINKYTVGAFSSPEEAAKMQTLMREKGFKGAFVVKFVDGQRVK